MLSVLLVGTATARRIRAGEAAALAEALQAFTLVAAVARMWTP